MPTATASSGTSRSATARTISWKQHTIDDTWTQAHSLALADLDGCGVPELITGKRFMAHNGGDPDEYGKLGLYYYKLIRKPDKTVEWKKYVISYDEGIGAGLAIWTGDFRGSGRDRHHRHRQVRRPGVVREQEVYPFPHFRQMRSGMKACTISAVFPGLIGSMHFAGPCRRPAGEALRHRQSSARLGTVRCGRLLAACLRHRIPAQGHSDQRHGAWGRGYGVRGLGDQRDPRLQHDLQ